MVSMRHGTRIVNEVDSVSSTPEYALPFIAIRFERQDWSRNL